MNNAKTNSSTLYRSVAPSDLTPDEASVLDAIKNELTKPVSVEIYNNPRHPNNKTLFVKVIGFDGTLYPLVNRNNVLKPGQAGQVSINTVLDRINRGLKLFSV